MIEFILNNNTIKADVKSGMTLLHFIREHQGLKGTKSGCKEGDCGACTVLSGSLQKDNSVDYKSITSCLTPMANVHGKHIVTVEGVNLKNELNASQQAIKDNFATQCGFCTPGFVNSLSGLALKHTHPTEADGIDALGGNICRCTGYKSIEKAAHEVTHKLQEKDHSNELEWLVENKFVPNYFKEIPTKLKALNIDKNNSEGVLVSGGTDLYVRYADTLLDQDIQQATNFVANNIEFTDIKCTIGAGASVTDLLENERLNSYFPNLKAHLKLLSSEQIRNMASLGGNFVNASPIGDMAIFFLALNSSLHIQNSIAETREIILKDFFLDYKKIALKENEFIQSIVFNLPTENTNFNFEKVSKRTHLDIATVNAAITVNVRDNVIADTHIAVGGVAAIPKYLSETATYLIGKELTKEHIIKAQEIMQTEISPISDVRGADQYKRLLARQLFFAHFIKLYPNLFQFKDFIA
jgi:xanthine dehydrogenase small subunit